MSFLEANRKIVRSRFPGLDGILAPYFTRIIEHGSTLTLMADDGSGSAKSPERRFQVESAANGEPSLKADGRWVHSRFDPGREGRRLAEEVPGDGTLVVLGFGLGYAAEAACEAGADRAIVIAEKDPGLLALALCARDLTRLLGRERIAFSVPASANSVCAALETVGGKPVVLSCRAFRDLDPVWYDGVEQALRTIQAKDEINSATLRRFGKRWIRNLGTNLEAIRNLPGISRLAGVLEGLPVLLVAAGPTLDECLPHLAELSRRAALVVVDTALRSVLSAGVRPDFIIVVDPQYWNARHLDRCSVPFSTLITESAVYPAVLRMDCGRSFLCSSLFPLGTFVESRVDPKGALGAGGSVATTAWDFARLLGASPLWVAGLDLGFPALKTHFRGALFEERVHTEATRLDTGETRSFRALRDGKPFYALDRSGGRLLTDKRLSLYAAWFEARFARHPEARPFSLSPKGLRIRGMEDTQVEALLNFPECRREIENRLARAFASVDQEFRSPQNREELDRKYVAALSGLRGELVSLRDASRTAVVQARAALEGLDRSRLSPPDANGLEDIKVSVDQAMQALGIANAMVKESSAKEVAGFLFPPLAELEALLVSDPGEALRRHLELSLLLHERIAEDADFHERVLTPLAEKRNFQQSLA